LTTSAPRATWAVTLALLLAGVGCLLVWADGSTNEVALGRTALVVQPVAVVEPAAAADVPRRGSRPARPAKPVAVDIPAIGVTSVLDRLGLQRNGEVAVPQDPSHAGWYRLGARPGEKGSAVILGHVDSTSGPAVFYDLRRLQRRDRVQVTLADGTTVGYRVATVTTYLNDDFPAQQVYGARQARVLTLVTCGGEYDAARGGYQANVVVTARWDRAAR
jgi:hypothetical protein